MKNHLLFPIVSLNSHYAANTTVIVILKLWLVQFTKQNPVRLHLVEHFTKTKQKNLPLLRWKYKVRLLPAKQSRCKIFALLKLREIPGLEILSYTTVVMKKDWKIIRET